MYGYYCPFMRGNDFRRKSGYRQKTFTMDEAMKIGKQIGIDFTKINPEQFRMGLGVELEHGIRFPQANVTNDDPIMTGKIAYAHLLEIPDYYTRLAKLEKEAKGSGVKED